jgi:hypothetical protein
LEKLAEENAHRLLLFGEVELMETHPRPPKVGGRSNLKLIASIEVEKI